MRLRGFVINHELFLKIAQTIEKISKTCVIAFSPEFITFIIGNDKENSQVWARIDKKKLFSELVVESLNNNKIGFELTLDHLIKTLRSAVGSAPEILVRLRKGPHYPFLSFTIDNPSMKIAQEIPVMTLSASQLEGLTEPSMPEPNVWILMPQLKLVQRVIDRMKNMSNILKIEANQAGQLVFSIETDLVTVSTFHKNLTNPQLTEHPVEVNPEIRCAVTVDIKKFHKFLYSHLVSPRVVLCGLVENTAVVLHVALDDVNITYYIPVHAS